MNNNINLLPKVKRKVQTDKYLQTYRIVAVVILSSTLIISVGLFLLSLDPTLSTLKKQENFTNSSLYSKQVKIGKYLFVKDRLKKTQELLNKRSSFDATLFAIQNQITNDISVDTLSISKKKFILSISSASLESINAFVDKITNIMYAKKIFANIRIDSLTDDEKANKYYLSMESDLL